MKGLLIRTAILLALLAQQPPAAHSQSPSSPEINYDCAGIPNGTTQVTDCGCGKPSSSTFLCKACEDNTSCLDCAGTPFGKRVPSGPVNGVPSSDPCKFVCPQEMLLDPTSSLCVSKKELCDRVQANIVDVGVTIYHPTRSPTTNVTSAVVQEGDAGISAFTTFDAVNQASSCVGRVLTDCLPRGRTIDYMLVSRRQGGNNNDADRCVVNKVLAWGVTYKYDGKFWLFGAPTDQWSGRAFVSRSTEKGCGPAPRELINLAVAAGCNLAKINVVEFDSPVSLLWTDDVEIEKILSFAPFPLDGKSPGNGRLFQWRASGMTPLVVYDSTGLGEIKDATQLFGTHTFGKQWKDGYEALASLDIDKSGWLEGEELNAVALWFDFNQDGFSQKGEVKRLSDAGVHAIGVRSDSTDEKTRSIFASKGFKRTVDGKEYTGRSVDWFGGVAQGSLPAPQAAADSTTQAAANQDAEDLNAETIKVDLRSTVSGVWEWRMIDDKMLLPEQQPGGVLAFTQEGDSIRGQSVSTRRFLPNMYKIDELITAIPVSGKFGKDGVSFEIKGEKKPRAQSSAKLSADGMTLTGTTTEEVPITGGTAKVTFAWEAKRLIREQ